MEKENTVSKTHNYEYLKELETPCYIVNCSKLEENCLEIMHAFQERWSENVKFGYSVKTNNSDKLIDICVKKFGWYIETVSAAEYEYVKSLGYEDKKIILNGPYKGRSLYQALGNGGMINFDNLQEIQSLCTMVQNNRSLARLCEKALFGIRVNFDLEKACPDETTAGKKGSRFGICYENGELKKAILLLKQNGIAVKGLHMHYSTITRSEKVFREIAKNVIEITEKYQLNLEYIDIGGGFFGGKVNPDRPTMKEYAQCICEILKKRFHPQETALILEPGVSVLATCVEYVTKVINVRNIRDSFFVTVDGTVLHINPFMREREVHYKIVKRDNKLERNKKKKYDQTVVGATCMENDRFFTSKSNEFLSQDDYVVFEDAGAYTLSFNSEFILKKPEIYLFP